MLNAMNVNEDLKTLELEPGASADDIRKAWIDLTKVWHPDRFASDPDLQERAEEKLKGINAAYERLRFQSDTRSRRSSRPSASGSPTETAGADEPWRVRGTGQEAEAADLRTLLTWVARGMVDERDEVFHPVEQRWLPLTEIPEAARMIAARRRVVTWRRALIAAVVALFLFVRRPSFAALLTALVVFLSIFALLGGGRKSEG